MARFAIDPERSRVFIDARSTLHQIHSTTNGLDGFVELEMQGDGRLNLTVPPQGRMSLPVDRLRTGNRLEDRELKRRVNARRFPTIDGALVEMRATEKDGRYRLRGDLTFLGVTRSYENDVDVAQLDDLTLQLSGSARFDVRDFGLEPPQLLLLKVEPEVTVRVEIVAAREL
jgi:polyisoprenoid-binding protein YceI